MALPIVTVTYKSAEVQLNVVDGVPPTDQSAELAAMASQVQTLSAQVATLTAQVTKLTSDLAAANAKIAAAKVAAQAVKDRDAANVEGQAVLDALA